MKMKTVWTYYFEDSFDASFEMPKGAEIVHCALHKGKYCLWALVDPDAEKEIRQFTSYPTGHIMRDLTLRYIGTITDDPAVVHVFEIIKKNDETSDINEEWKNEMERMERERQAYYKKLFSPERRAKLQEERERKNHAILRILSSIICFFMALDLAWFWFSILEKKREQVFIAVGIMGLLFLMVFGVLQFFKWWGKQDLYLVFNESSNENETED